MTTTRYSIRSLMGFLVLFMPSLAFGQSGVGSLQIIHNVADAGPVDVYLDGTRYLDNFDFRTATPFETILTGTYTLDFVAGQDDDNTNPFFTTTLTISDVAYVVIAHGLLKPDAQQPPFDLTVIENARVEAGPDDVEVAVVHGAPDLAAIDVRLLDPVDNNSAFALLANNIDYNTVVLYQDLEPLGYNVEVSTFDNDVQYEVFRLELQAFRSKTLILIVSGTGNSESEGLDIIFVAANGAVAQAPVITAATNAEALPGSFALRGNYPNPFNPHTTIHLDIPYTAQVYATLYDLQGRRVLTTPAQQLAAGEGRALRIEATGLPSGLYVYHVFAESTSERFTAHGKMMLVQ